MSKRTLSNSIIIIAYVVVDMCDLLSNLSLECVHLSAGKEIINKNYLCQWFMRKVDEMCSESTSGNYVHLYRSSEEKSLNNSIDW